MLRAGAQVSEPNIDFELGNTSYWRFDTGACCPIALSGLVHPAMVNRHALTNGGATDPYGGFPIVSPDGGSYSLKLGNDNVGAKAESAEYTVHVPTGSASYSVVFRYAVVFENPGHDMDEQPRFTVSAKDSATGGLIDCAQYVYVATSGLPGFQSSTVDTMVKYKDWTTAYIDLTAHAGKTIIVQFATGDCKLGGHFGYGYIDVSTGLFAVSAYSCAGAAELRGPNGYAYYYWYNAGFTTLVDTGRVISVSNLPGSGPKTYAVVVMPYPGYGCPDTLYTTIKPKDIVSTEVNIECAGKDVKLTGPDSVQTYRWYDATYSSVLGTNRTLVLHNLPGPGTYPLIVVGDTTLGCPDTMLVKVNPAVEPDSLIGQAYCNDDVELSVRYSNAKYYWYNEAGVLVDSGDHVLIYDVTEPTTYILVIRPDEGIVCFDTIRYTVMPRPRNQRVLANILNCNATDLVLEGPAGYTNYLWYDASTMDMIGTTRTMDLDNPATDKTYLLILRAPTVAECYDTVRNLVRPSHMIPVPQPDKEVCKGKLLPLKAEASGGNGKLTYAWEPAAEMTCATCEHTKAHIQDAGKYTVTIKDEGGCTVTDTIEVTLDTCVLVVPNAFTPNGDGKNDIFRVTGTGFEWFQSFSLSVFNRYGQRVFYTEDINEGWDGVFKGTHQDVNTFFYMVLYTLNDEQYMLKGDVTLVR